MRTVETTAAHEHLFRDIVQVLMTYEDKLDSEEMMAVLARMVGYMIALQDKNKMTPQIAIEVVQANMQEGNRYAIKTLFTPTGDDFDTEGNA